MDRTPHTIITSSWIPSFQWLDGWSVINDAVAMQVPCVWLINPKSFIGALPRHVDSLLSADELAKAMRFHQADHVLRFKAAHTALRLVLGHVTDQDPAGIRFAKGHHHKPILENQHGPEVPFNLSYTENRAMIGLTSSQTVGVDIEWCERPFDIETMLDACFSAAEIAFIREQRENMLYRFFTLWTRKEAILKLTGEGIGDHLPHFEVLDGVCHAQKQIIGGRPPDQVFLYSFEVEEGFIGCLASPRPLPEISFYRL